MIEVPVFSESEKTVIYSADKALGDCLEEGNLDAAAEMLNSYRGLKRVSDLATSKLLHGINLHWEHVEHEENSFIDWTYRNSGYVRLSTMRHISTWEMLHNHVPNEFRVNFMQQTLRQLWKEFSLVVLPKETSAGNFRFDPSGVEVSHEDWRDLSEAIDEYRTAELVAKIKGKERSGNLVALRMDANGDVWVHDKKGRKFVFSMPVGSQDELIEKAVEKVMNGSGIKYYENP